MLILGSGTFFLVLEKYIPDLEVYPASEMGMSLAVPQIHGHTVLSPPSGLDAASSQSSQW